MLLEILFADHAHPFQSNHVIAINFLRRIVLEFHYPQYNSSVSMSYLKKDECPRIEEV